MSYLLKRTLLAILLTLVPVAVFGQAISGDLVGAVRDSSGAVVPNASVEATNLGTAYKTSTTTSTSGEYRFSNLPAGHYSLQATSGSLKGGFADIESGAEQDCHGQHHSHGRWDDNDGGSQRTSYNH